MSSSNLRKIVVDGREYGWRCGKKNVLIRDTSGKGHPVSIQEFGYSEKDIDNRNFSITPEGVRNQIIRLGLN